MELLSIVVPAYNLGAYLPRCLDSILNQTYENLEVIVVDDGSADDTRTVLTAYAATHDRVYAIFQENQGVTAARLRGVAEAKGEWIGFIDGDDEIEPQMYARLLENARENGAEISHCGHQVLFPGGRVEKVHGTGVLRPQDQETALRDLLDGGMIEGSLCTKVFRRELFAGLEDWMDPTIRNNEDLLMNFYLFGNAARAVYEDVCPYHYILRHGSASYNRYNEHSLFDPIRVRQKMLDRCPPALQDDGRRALLRNCLFAYGQTAVQKKEERERFAPRIRQILAEQKAYFPLLSTRNRILANMILRAPWSFHLAYGLYVKLFQREEQH